MQKTKSRPYKGLGYSLVDYQACPTSAKVSLITSRYVHTKAPLISELLNVTPWSHADYGSLELANKEITRVAERINVPTLCKCTDV
jgi:hypothetical protein